MKTIEAFTRPAAPQQRASWPWWAAWTLIGVAMCVGIAGAFTIGVFVLPVAVLAAALLGVAQYTRRRDVQEASGAAWTPDGRRIPSTNRLAKLSLVLGIASMVASPPTAIAGVITGVLARREIRRSDGAETGAGLALAGIVTSLLGLVIVTALLLSLNRAH